MPEFLLGGKLAIDLSEVEALPGELEKAIAGTGVKRTNLEVAVQDGQAKTQLADLQKQATTLGKTVAKPLVNIDTAPAMEALTAVQAKAVQTTEKINSQKPTMNVGTSGAASAFNMQNVAGGMMMMGIGAGGAMGLKEMLTSGVTGAIRQARLESNIANLMGGGAAGQTAVANAKALSAGTGYDPTTIMTTTANLVDMQEEMGTSNDEMQALTSRIADMARSTGLPQYADSMDSVRQAVTAGVASGRGMGLKQMGVNISAVYMKTEFMNGALKKTYDTMDASTQAHYRYLAVMEQTANIAGAAAKASPEKSFDALKTSAEEAGIALGKGLVPVLQFVSSVASAMPKPLIEAAMVLGGLAAAAIPLAMMGFGIKGAEAMGKSVISGAKGMVGKVTGKFGGGGEETAAASTKAAGTEVASAMSQAAAEIKTAGTEAAGQIAGAGTTAGTEVAGAGTAAGTEIAGAGTTAGAEIAGAGAAGGVEIGTSETILAGVIQTGSVEIMTAEQVAAARIAAGGGGGLGAPLMGGMAGAAVIGGVVAAGLGATVAESLHLQGQATAQMEEADKHAASRLEVQQVATAKKTGMGDINDAAQAQYVVADIKSGVGGQFMYFNAAGQRLSSSIEAWQNSMRQGPAATGAGISVTIQDRTTQGVTASNVGSYAPTIH